MPDENLHASRYDLERRPVFERRECDWRIGPVVYQVFVDRFAPAEDLDAKRHLYPSPKRLRRWEKKPAKGEYLSEAEVWSHEIDFWGGDLASLARRLDYIQSLGADVLYLNPIHRAYTNHKYDAQDYFEVSPEYGTRDELKRLADELHRRGMRLMLDGVFNHMGRTAPSFREALNDPESPWREWFLFSAEKPGDYRGWLGVANLPELRMESPEVQARIFGDPDSVVQGFLRDGVDGWRLDVAFELGFGLLARITEAAHRAKPDSVTIGEIVNYPDEWTPALDGVMNFFVRQLILHLLSGEITGPRAGRILSDLVRDAGIEPLLRSWLILDNHDVARLRTILPEPWQQRLAQVLQFTLPGAPCIYYGVEIGMEGGEDPEQRGPMRWDRVHECNPYLKWMRQLTGLRRECRALGIGDFVPLRSERCLAFLRRTDRVADSIVTVVNPSDVSSVEHLALRDAKLMDWARMRDVFDGEIGTVRAGILRVEVPARSARVLRLELPPAAHYNPYKRVL